MVTRRTPSGREEFTRRRFTRSVADELKEAVDPRLWAVRDVPPQGPNEPPGGPWLGAQPAEPSWDQPGGLDIKEERSWRTWHLLTAALAALLVGLAIGHSNAKPANGGAQKGGLFTLPGSPGSPGTPTSVEAESATTTTSASVSNTTLAPETPATGIPKVLFDKKAAGPLAATPVSIKGGTWKIGWAFDCTRAGTADGSAPFQIAVAPASGAAAIAVDEVGRNKTGITSQTASGPLTFEVRTACRWAVKVTGVPS